MRDRLQIYRSLVQEVEPLKNVSIRDVARVWQLAFIPLAHLGQMAGRGAIRDPGRAVVNRRLPLMAYTRRSMYLRGLPCTVVFGETVHPSAVYPEIVPCLPQTSLAPPKFFTYSKVTRVSIAQTAPL